MATSMKLLHFSLGNLEKLLISSTHGRCLATSSIVSALPTVLPNNTSHTLQQRQYHVSQRKLLQTTPVHRCSTSIYSLNYSTDTSDVTAETQAEPPSPDPVVEDTVTQAEPSHPVRVVEDTDEPDILYKKLILEVKGHDTKVLNSYDRFVRSAADHLGVDLVNVLTPKMDVYRQSVLASVHIYKKHQVQYEERTYYRVFEFQHLTGSTADTFLEYVQRNLPEGTAMKVTKHQVLQMPQHLKPPKKRLES